MFDILETIKAIYTQTGHCSKLELIYNNSDEKEKILSAIKEVSNTLEYKVKISDNIDAENRGFICIEFKSHDKELETFLSNLTNLIT